MTRSRLRRRRHFGTRERGRALATELQSRSRMAQITRVTWVVLTLAAVLCLIGTARPTQVQDWPQRPIRIIVSFGPGGGADIIARILAEALRDQLGQPVIVENRPGAGGILGNEAVANAAPDGYTLGIMTAGQVIAGVMRKHIPYQPDALTPVTQVATGSLLIVARPDFRASNVKELIAAARADPGKIVFASPGFAATQHFAGELFKQIAGVDVLHVPYRSSPEAINAVLGKHADLLFDTVPALIGQIQSGSLKVLAVTGKDRFPPLPNVPAAIESGVLPGYNVTTWYGVFGPPDIPAPVVAGLNKTIGDILADDKMRERLIAVGVIVRGSGAEEFGKFMSGEQKRWNAVREAAGIQPQ